ncbi:helix-turn-helix transcriptional regulator [Salinarimonas soli]|uniref:YafY family transcriptional regulator n=1 Tax=Salinarimonas soli TaxID=1638099 RepID=A0A5B2VFW0_9HYPH|nr:YafY family protein [Salinarimonas soli]KAA2237360.1 YafY family transcriptional regulator [Salinarimonas soli]
MARSERLLDLLQILRRHRRPVTGAQLADELGVSLRTLYRDIGALMGQGAPIEGEAGVGYVLRPGFTLPPLMFTDEEIEAVVLGARWVAQNGDPSLAAAARDALAKIADVLPAGLRDRAQTSGLLAVPEEAEPGADLGLVREAIQAERKLRITYMDGAGEWTERTVWPFALAFFKQARVVAAWCELRAGFRHFRVDRIAAPALLPERYPRRRAALTAEWRLKEGIPDLT